MNNKDMLKKIINEYNEVIIELTKKKLISDMVGLSNTDYGEKTRISWSGKNETNTILFDMDLSASQIIQELLNNRQYSFLLYDKGLFQFECEIINGKIVKQRLLFIKKHNRYFDLQEITKNSNLGEEATQWFEEEFGIPIMIRIDYDVDNYQEVTHPKSHFTMSNYESCRLPLKGIMSFSTFVKFILNNFYNEELIISEKYGDVTDELSDLEKKMVHMNWN